MMEIMNVYDIIIIGGGSGGVGTALAASDYDKTLNILLIEKESLLGGTSTICGVNNWEPGVSSNLPYHYEMAQKLMEENSGCVGETTRFVANDFPFGLSEKSNSPYEDTLKRAGVKDTNFRRFHFDPFAMSLLLKDMLRQRNVEVMLNAEFVSCSVLNNKIEYIKVFNKIDDKEINLSAKIYIDASGDIVLAREAGCDYSIGSDTKADYNEPSAPEIKENTLNGVSLIFVIGKKETLAVDEIPEEYKNIDLSNWKNFDNGDSVTISFITKYNNGDLCVNMLPTMEGWEYYELGERAYEVSKARVYYYFNYLQRKYGMDKYEIKYIFPKLGVRESYRLKAEYVLNENDIRIGLDNKDLANRFIAIADHPLDTHGSKNSGLSSVNQPYGIPYEVMLPKEIKNLLVACRGAGFSHIAASSSRLSRTMMALGEAGGVASAMAIKENITLKNIDLLSLRKYLKLV